MATDPSQQLKNLESEIQRVEQRRKDTMKRMLASTRQVQSLIEFSEQELEKVKREPSPEKRAQLVRKSELRRKGALSNLENLTLLSSLDLTKPIPPTVTAQIELNCLKTQYITTEYYMTHYRRVITLIEQVLSQGDEPAGQAPAAAAADPKAAPGARPLPGRTGPLAGAAGPAAPGPAAPGPARPGMPPRPGLPARPVPGARPMPGASPLAARTQAPGQPGPLAARAAGGGTGSLNTPPRQGSGPLSARATGTGQLRAGTGNLNPDAELLKLLQAAVAEEGGRPKLSVILERFTELELTLEPLRGQEPGQLAFEVSMVAPQLRQIAGKVYYLNRAAEALGDKLGTMLQFEAGDPNPQVVSLLDQVEAEPVAPPPEEAKPADVPLSSRLKSLFKP